MKNPGTASHEKGFTLLEISIVISIIAVLGVGGIAALISSMQTRQRTDTINKLATIQLALTNYRLAFNRLPCPADAGKLISDQYFGVEAANLGDCIGGTPAANFGDGAGATDPREGMVPTKTLRLSDDYAIDGWGRKIMYAVSRDVTQAGGFSVVPVDDANTRMSVHDASGADKTDKAIYVLFRHGVNGHGAYPRDSASRITSGSTNADEQQNCDCSSSAVAGGLNGIFVQKLPTQNSSSLIDVFDDVLVYATRSDLRSGNE